MMKIVIAEELNGRALPDRSLTGPVIKIGRDPKDCQVVFEQAKWPMVSRKHAEFIELNGRCFLNDTKSSYGTYANGVKLDQPIEVSVGMRVQFGQSGPVVLIRNLEVSPPVAPSAPAKAFSDSETQRDLARAPMPVPQAPAPFNAQPVHEPSFRPSPPPVVEVRQPVQLPQNGGDAPTGTAYLELLGDVSNLPRKFPLVNDLVRMGREPDNDIPIDAAAAVVSRRHAEIHKRADGYYLVDLGSFNGTLLNNQRVTQSVRLETGDLIQLGLGGPEFAFEHISAQTNRGSQGLASPSGGLKKNLISPHLGTMVAGVGTGGVQAGVTGKPGLGSESASRLMIQVPFGSKRELTLGRAPECDIHVDGLQISNRHAKVINSGGGILIEDTNSTNGVYVNGARITGRRPVTPDDVIQIGPFLIRVDLVKGVAVFDTRSKTRIDVIDITKEVANRSGGGKIKLLDDVDLTIQPNEFVGLLGPSGAGKSTLMDSLNGMRPATSGHVLINNLDLYQHLDSLKQSIGYVPQDDIIHRELTVYRTLYYVARLRLSRDISTREIEQIVNEVMDVTGLSERRDVPVGQLSGGQRKRVSIAVELITKPSVIFLDEPTSGLDPATEEKIMKLFRQIAESGRTVILTTHAMENVRLFDKIVVMMRGKLIFYGAPQEALDHIQAESFKDLYDKLEEPIDQRIAALGQLPPNATPQQKSALKKQKEQISEEVAEEWKKKFHSTPQYRKNVVLPLEGIKQTVQAAPPAGRSVTVTDSVRQWATLSRRYMEVLMRDRFNLLILLAQAPIIAFLTALVVSETATRDFPFFMLALVAVWFGTSVAAREVIRERAVYNRERMVNLGLMPYIGSKLLVLSFIVGIQCVMLFGALKFFDLIGWMKLPGYLLGIPQLLIVLLTAAVGITMGLFVSAVVKTSEMATSLVPLLLIPQILFCGLVGVPNSFTTKAIGLVMPATWSFDEIKRLAPVATLREEGSDKDGPNKGRGLYGHIEDTNDANIAKARRDLERYKSDAEDNLDKFDKDMRDYLSEVRTNPSAKPPEKPTLSEVPSVPDADKVPKDLSGYVDFLHPWGNVVLNPIMLMLMFFGLVIATVLALKAQDIG